MLTLNHYTKDFKNQLKLLLKNYEENKVALKPFDYEILKEIYSLIEISIDFAMPYYPSDYKDYDKKKSLDMYDLKTTIAYEFNFECYSKEFKINKKLETKIPYIIFTIPLINDNLKKLSFHTGTEIHGNLVFMVRKYASHWELPTKGFIVDNDYKLIEEILIFSNLHFNLSIEKDAETLSHAEILYKREVLDRLFNYSKIALTNIETIMATKRDLIVATAFLSPINKISDFDISKRIEKNGVLLYNNNLLYSLSIRF